jgi:hypothetical protein
VIISDDHVSALSCIVPGTAFFSAFKIILLIYKAGQILGMLFYSKQSLKAV